MRVLVTGASGLVGGRLLEAAVRGGTIRVRAASRVERSWPEGVEGVTIDSSAPETIAAACERVDAVVNLASMPEGACAADPVGALRANVGGTMGLVGAAVTAGVGRFVQLSTSKVYGNNPSGVITEQTAARPTSHYAITHRAAEDYAALHPSAVVLRLANGFGAPLDAAASSWSVIANDFCRQAVTTHQIVVRGDGTAWRNFVPLDDVVVALQAAIADLPSGTYNVGAPASTTILGMAERIAAVCEVVLGARPEVCVSAAPIGAPPEALDYRTDRLRAAGVFMTALVDEEIERTLRFAQATFAGARCG